MTDPDYIGVEYVPTALLEPTVVFLAPIKKPVERPMSALEECDAGAWWSNFNAPTGVELERIWHSLLRGPVDE